MYSRLADDDESVPLLELLELIEEDMLDDITNDRGREERLRKKLEERNGIRLGPLIISSSPLHFRHFFIET